MKDGVRFKWKALFFFSTIVLFSPFPVLSEKYYDMTHLDLTAELLADGSMEVTESRTYAFRGSYSFAYRYLPADGSVSFQGFQIFENDTPYQKSESEMPGTYRIVEEGGTIEVRWFFRARNESRTFDFHYHVLDAVKRYEDAAVLYFQFISRDWEKEQKDIYLKLKAPESISKDRINAWLHGPLWAEYRIEEEGTITAWCSYLPRHTYFEVRALYPTDSFPETKRLSGLVRSQIMAEEAKWAEEANRMRKMAIQKREAQIKRWGLGKQIGMAISLAGILGWFLLFRKYGKRPSIPVLSKIASDVPAKTPPALVAYLVNRRQIYGGALVGTLFDLARRSFLSLREEEKEQKMLFGKMAKRSEYFWDLNRSHWNTYASELTDYENGLIRFLFDDLASGKDSIDLKTIQKKRSQFVLFFSTWKKEVKKHGEEKKWFDKESVRGFAYSLGMGGGLLLLTIPSAIFFGPWSGLLVGTSILVFLLSLIIPHRTREGEMEAQNWLALKRYLLKYHYRESDKKILLNRMDDYFVYGIVLGLNKKIFKELAGFIPADSHSRYFPWYVYHGTGEGSFTPDTFAASFSAMISTATSAMSTASGTGGGATGGGGGGAGSGGGGAG